MKKMGGLPICLALHRISPLAAFRIVLRQAGFRVEQGQGGGWLAAAVAPNAGQSLLPGGGFSPELAKLTDRGISPKLIAVPAGSPHVGWREG